MRIKIAAAAAALAMGTLLAGTTGASAAGGCGPGWHPNPWGHCRPNLRPYGYGPRFGFYGPRHGWYGPRPVYHRHWGHRHGWHGPRW